MVPHDDGVLVPAFQLDDAGEVREELRPVLAALLSDAARNRVDPWQVWGWLVRPAALLGGAVPAEAVLDPEEAPLVQHAADTGFARIGRALDETIANMPAKWVGWLLRPILRPGAHARGPTDKVREAVAKLVYEPSASRDRLVSGFHPPKAHSGLGLLDKAFKLVMEAEPITKRLRTARKSPRDGLEAGILSDAEFEQLKRVEEAVQKVVAVDDYTPDELLRLFPEMHGRATWPEAAE